MYLAWMHIQHAGTRCTMGKRAPSGPATCEKRATTTRTRTAVYTSTSAPLTAEHIRARRQTRATTTWAMPTHPTNGIRIGEALRPGSPKRATPVLAPVVTMDRAHPKSVGHSLMIRILDILTMAYENEVDIICLQEVTTPPPSYERMELTARQAGYPHTAFGPVATENGRYEGRARVAIFSKRKIQSSKPFDEDGRVQFVRCGTGGPTDIVVASMYAYVSDGGAGGIYSSQRREQLYHRIHTALVAG